MRDREELQAQLDALHDDFSMKIARLHSLSAQDTSRYSKGATVEISRIAQELLQFDNYIGILERKLQYYDNNIQKIGLRAIETTFQEQLRVLAAAWVAFLSLTRAQFITELETVPSFDSIAAYLYDLADYRILRWVLGKDKFGPWTVE